MSTRSFRVGLLSYQIIGAVCVVFSLGCSIGAFLAKQYSPIVIFAFLGIMGAYIILDAGYFELSDDAVTHQSFFGRFRMAWKEVLKIECGTGGSIVLHGEDKRFVLSPPAYWSGKQQAEAFELLRKKIEELGVTSYPSNVADYKTNKNVRIRKTKA